MHTLPLGSGRDEYSSKAPTAPASPEGQPEAAKPQM